MSEAMQSSEAVAKRHYIHKQTHSTAFAEFYNLITSNDNPKEKVSLKEKINIKEVTAMDSTDEEKQLPKNIAEEKNNQSRQEEDNLKTGDVIAVVYDTWYLGEVLDPKSILVCFYETTGNNRYNLTT